MSRNVELKASVEAGVKGVGKGRVEVDILDLARVMTGDIPLEEIPKVTLKGETAPEPPAKEEVENAFAYLLPQGEPPVKVRLNARAAAQEYIRVLEARDSSLARGRAFQQDFYAKLQPRRLTPVRSEGRARW
jgi:hypothetical protein